jgi:putative glutamine amidotransferase
MIPRIAIPLPTSFDLEYNRQNYAGYADAIIASGGEPVSVPLDMDTAELAHLAAGCDGILLPGSPADVDPAKYGQDREEATAPADFPRENVDEFLLADALRSTKPIFGICFGTQMLNVFSGGTLVQDLMILPVNHPAGRAVMVAHSAAVAPGSLLAASIDAAETTPAGGFLRLPVNSSHHQAVGIVGEGLAVSARCPQDGVVEAIEASSQGGGFVLGVQWHPERTFETSPSSRSLFAGFIHAAAARAAVAR